ncbi:MAG: rhodanese-like domain-containing protein [Candidatus Binatia bacterium]
MEPATLNVSDVKERMEQGEAIVFVDARNAKAWENSDVKLPGAVRIPADEAEQRLAQLPRDRMIIPYCT